MKKLLTLTTALAALLTIVSCGGDEPNLGNLTVNETLVSKYLKNAYIIDDGFCCSPRGEIYQSKNTTFLLTDGQFVFDNTGEIEDFIEGPLNLEIRLNVDSEGTAFTYGEYSFYDDCSSSGIVYGVDTYANWYEGEDYLEYNGRSGSVTITGSGNSYTLNFDGTLYYYDEFNEGVECQLYTGIDITGQLTRKFTPISMEAWYNWD